MDLGGYPDRWRQDDLELDLRYRFRPGEPDDGVTVEIPLEVLNRVRSGGFDWNVPGYRVELVAALIRSLPKAIRRDLGPATDAAREALEGCGPDEGPLLGVMAGRLAKMSGHPVDPGVWDRSVLPAHLTVAFELRDGPRVLGRGRDLDQMRSAHRMESHQALLRAAPDLVRHGSTAWDFGDIPKVVARGPVRAYPALVDEGDGVGLTVTDSPEAQGRSMWPATRRLLRLAVQLPHGHLQRRLTNETKLALARSGTSVSELLEDCATAVVDQIIIGHGGPPLTASGFEEMVAAARRDLTDRVARVATIAGGIMAAAELVLGRVAQLEDRRPDGAVAAALAEVRGQVEGLVLPGFVTTTGTTRLRDLLRYLDAAGRRVERLPGDVRRDRERQAVVDRVRSRYEARLDRGGVEGAGAGLAEIRWMIEELRVSLWAQTLGTPAPISEARISRALDRMGA